MCLVSYSEAPSTCGRPLCEVCWALVAGGCTVSSCLFCRKHRLLLPFFSFLFHEHHNERHSSGPFCTVGNTCVQHHLGNCPLVMGSFGHGHVGVVVETGAVQEINRWQLQRSLQGCQINHMGDLLHNNIRIWLFRFYREFQFQSFEWCGR